MGSERIRSWKIRALDRGIPIVEMSEKNCRTVIELDDETSRLYGILGNSARPDPQTFEAAASKACDSTLACLMTRISDSPLADPWVGAIQAILDMRKNDRAARQ